MPEHDAGNQSALFLVEIFIMSRFARVGEEVFLRYQELVSEDKHGEKYKFASKETLFLYLLILLNTFTESGICKKTIGEICKIYSLDYDNSMRRYKILRKRRWCEKTKQGIRPLVGVKTVNSTDDLKTVNSTVEDNPKTVNSTVPNCKNYSKTDEKTVNSTVSDEAIYKEFKESLKSSEFSQTAAAEKTAAAAADSNGHQSKFSIEECMRYAEICVLRGEPIKNPHGMAQAAYQTGTHDVFIQARLYPEQTENAITTATGEEISEDRREALAILTDMASSGEDISDMKKWYTPETWAWIEERLKTE